MAARGAVREEEQAEVLPPVVRQQEELLREEEPAEVLPPVARQQEEQLRQEKQAEVLPPVVWQHEEQLREEKQAEVLPPVARQQEEQVRVEEEDLPSVIQKEVEEQPPLKKVKYYDLTYSTAPASAATDTSKAKGCCGDTPGKALSIKERAEILKEEGKLEVERALKFLGAQPKVIESLVHSTKKSELARWGKNYRPSVETTLASVGAQLIWIENSKNEVIAALICEVAECNGVIVHCYAQQTEQLARAVVDGQEYIDSYPKHYLELLTSAAVQGETKVEFKDKTKPPPGLMFDVANYKCAGTVKTFKSEDLSFYKIRPSAVDKTLCDVMIVGFPPVWITVHRDRLTETTREILKKMKLNEVTTLTGHKETLAVPTCTENRFVNMPQVPLTLRQPNDKHDCSYRACLLAINLVSGESKLGERILDEVLRGELSENKSLPEVVAHLIEGRKKTEFPDEKICQFHRVPGVKELEESLRLLEDTKGEGKVMMVTFQSDYGQRNHTIVIDRRKEPLIWDCMDIYAKPYTFETLIEVYESQNCKGGGFGRFCDAYSVTVKDSKKKKKQSKKTTFMKVA